MLLEKFAYDPTDTDDLKLKKVASVIIAGACSIAGIGWAAMYYLIYGFGLTAILPASFVVIAGLCILVAHLTKNHLWSTYGLIVCIMYITAGIQWSIGGMFDSGFVMAWSIVGPITALMFFSLREAIVWFSLFFLNIVITAVFDDYFSLHAIPIDQAISQMYFVMNLGVSSLVVFIFASYFVSSIQKEKQRSEGLLLNILPLEVANELKVSGSVVPRDFEDTTVLFTDFKGFTDLAGKMTAKELVEEIDTCFTTFDYIATKYNVEKVKTIGDAYMAVGGGINSTDCPPCNVIRAGLEMQAFMEQRKKALQENGKPFFEMRLGIHTGHVVAGVVGVKKFQYDIWGDTVNIASRMESHGEVGRVNISSATYEMVKDRPDLAFTKREKLTVKGKGEMEMYFVSPRREKG